MYAFFIIVLLTIAVLVLVYQTDRQEEQNERLKRQLRIEKIRSKTYCTHAEELYRKIKTGVKGNDENQA